MLSKRLASPNIILAPQSVRPYSISDPTHHEFKGTQTAPIDVIAIKRITYSGLFGIQIATLSPFSIPSEIN